MFSAYQGPMGARIDFFEADGVAFIGRIRIGRIRIQGLAQPG